MAFSNKCDLSRRWVQRPLIISAQVVDALEEDTILFVMGDHGMTADGNHGGHTERCAI